LLLYYGVLRLENNNKNEIPPLRTTLPQFIPLSEEGWGRRVVVKFEHNDVDDELVSIWENAKLIKISSFDAKIISSTTSECLIESKGLTEIYAIDWKVASKRNALEKIARLISSLSQDSEKLRSGFVNGKITSLLFNEKDRSVQLSFLSHLTCFKNRTYG